MEDLSRNLGPDPQLKGTSCTSKDRKSYSVILVGDLGKILSFHLTKPFVIVFTACLVAVFAIFVYSVASYNSVLLENRKLEGGMDALRRDLESAKKVGEEASLRLVLLGDSVNRVAKKASTQFEQEAKDVASQGTKQDSGAKEDEDAETSETPRPLASAPRSTQPDRGTTNSPVTGTRVSIENLEIWYEPDGNAFKYQYVVKNIDQGGGKVAGYAFLVLRPKDDLEEPLRAFPAAPLTNGKPSNFKNGRYFSIARHRAMQGTLTDVSTINRFQAAIVYAYSDEGDLLTEEVFELGNMF